MRNYRANKYIGSFRREKGGDTGVFPFFGQVHLLSQNTYSGRNEVNIMEELFFTMQSLTEAYQAKQLLSQNRIVSRIQRRTIPGRGCGYDIAVLREDGNRAASLLEKNHFTRRHGSARGGL